LNQPARPSSRALPTDKLHAKQGLELVLLLVLVLVLVLLMSCLGRPNRAKSLITTLGFSSRRPLAMPCSCHC
jgi:hypothetical protein